VSDQRNKLKEVENDPPLTASDRLALWITKMAGSMPMFYGLVFWYVGWIAVNMALGKLAFDPYPFNFLLFISNALQLIWLPVLSVGQMLSMRRDRRRMLENNQLLQNQEDTMAALLVLMQRLDFVMAKDYEEDRQTRQLIEDALDRGQLVHPEDGGKKHENIGD